MSKLVAQTAQTVCGCVWVGGCVCEGVGVGVVGAGCVCYVCVCACVKY